MSPREQADRLFDRVMRAAERGDTAEVSFFGPMALQAHQLLGKLDADARYHVGLIQAVSGNSAGALAQAESLEKALPDHLFVDILHAEAAKRRGDAGALRRAYRRYLESYEREWAKGRSEYAEHRTALEAFRTEARSALGGQPSR